MRCQYADFMHFACFHKLCLSIGISMRYMTQIAVKTGILMLGIP